MKLTFFGACGEVTGSNILIETGGKKLLLDCGFFQGGSEKEAKNFEPFPYDPKSIDFVIVGHAHLDHVGKLPKLFKEGFRGKIYATAPTKELARVVLEDTEKLMFEESKRDRKVRPLFDLDDVANVLSLFESLEYEEGFEIFDGIRIKLLNAGHILGSAITVLILEGKRLVYTSDLGNSPSELLDPPAVVESADYVISESTYGGKVHEDVETRTAKLAEIINNTISKKSVLMIPSFAIERTQELLHDIDHFCTLNNCVIPNFFLDSPLAEKATAVFEKYPEYLGKKITSDHKDSNFFGLDRVKITSSVDASKNIEGAPNPKVIIAGSGMMNGGRILYHLQDYISDPNNTLLVVGYQAEGTLGRRILGGAKSVRIFGKDYTVNARIVEIESYSAHADSPQLVDWISKIKNVKKVFLVHGEADQSEMLKQELVKHMETEVETPGIGRSFDL